MSSKYRVPVFKPAEDGIKPWLILKIASKTLRLAPKAGEIQYLHPLLDGHWVFARAASERPPFNRSPKGAANPKPPQDRLPTSETSSHQSHSQTGTPMQV
ncbi:MULTISPECIES: hypothetical protein [unclassified Bradyrhizobium]|uniref:hypothetical protein n=1 Tax=unclassified Bradyrhizobium TaxID=2631580 RepID=UPI001CD36A98|nr:MULTISPECIES: hypothetical protein [unclassified Bradyrhizobium]MCA1386482.1 hypothetical protein [Bradyrhizobium sp. BRP05]MCA1394593.1 hypothetical protein [Bradyrhizobium sp. IC3123]MCA1424210.1 hypothetical protein [Bradyrhizobium sp. BRP23]MCA1431273.1 hypothetical protein [Bradyrhizobium sp. NBAIM16]MCA1480696.1 hypothetical protein [Bradyrhizobium sp. NBAIM08]